MHVVCKPKIFEFMMTWNFLCGGYSSGSRKSSL